MGLSVCTLQAEALDLWTKVKNVKILVFSLVSEKAVQDRGHKGQGHRGQGPGPRSKVARFKVKCYNNETMAKVEKNIKNFSIPVSPAMSTGSSVELKVKPPVQAEGVMCRYLDAYPCVPVWGTVIGQIWGIAP